MSSSAEILTALDGTYQHIDGCLHRVFVKSSTLYQARTSPGRQEAEQYVIQPGAVQRMIDYKLLKRIS